MRGQRHCTDDATVEDAYKEALGDAGEKLHTNFTYSAFDSTKAPTFDRCPAGLQQLSGYVANMTADQLRKQMVERPTTYLLGHVNCCRWLDSVPQYRDGSGSDASRPR